MRSIGRLRLDRCAIMRRILFTSTAGFLAIIGPQFAMAQEKPETARLTAITVDLRGESPASKVYRAIWRDAFDQELAVREKLSKVTKRPPIFTADVFAASFTIAKGKIIVSATNTPTISCQSYTNLGLSPSLMTCPMRVALVQTDETKIIYRTDAFAFSIGVSDKGTFDNENPESRTSVTFDPVNKVLQTHLVEAGPHVEGFKSGADDTQIRLEY